MKVLFFIWGGLGFLFNLVTLIELHIPTSGGIGVGTSAYASATALIWIGGMIFFGMGSLVRRPTFSDYVEQPDTKVRRVEPVA
jgi:hypothetical protein